MIFHILYREIRDQNQYWRKAKGVYIDFDLAQHAAETYGDGSGMIDCLMHDENEEEMDEVEFVTGMPIWILIMCETVNGKLREGVVGAYLTEKSALRGWEKYVIAMNRSGFDIELRTWEFKINMQEA